MPSVDVLPANDEHAYLLAPQLRAEDVAECLAGGYSSGLHSLLVSLAVSDEAYALLFDGEVAALFGVARGSLLNGTAAVWLLTGHLADKYRIAFVRNMRIALAYLASKWPVLGNMVDARYTKAIRFLKYLGFEFGEPVFIGRDGVAFIPYWNRRI